MVDGGGSRVERGVRNRGVNGWSCFVQWSFSWGPYGVFLGR